MEEKSKRVSLRVATGTGLIAVLIYIIVLSIFKEKINAELTLSYFGTMLTAIVTIFGVMWQIEKNNEKMDEEKITKELNELSSLKKYIVYILEKEVDDNLDELMKTCDYGHSFKLIEVLLLKYTKTNDIENIFFEFDKQHLLKNLENLLKINNGDEVLKLQDSIKFANSLISNNISNLKLANICEELFIFKSKYENKLDEQTKDKIELLRLYMNLLHLTVFVAAEKNITLNFNIYILRIQEIINKKTINFYSYDAIQKNQELGKFIEEKLIYRGDYIMEIYIYQLDFLYNFLKIIKIDMLIWSYEEMKLEKLINEIEKEKILMNKIKYRVPSIEKKIYDLKKYFENN